MSDTRLWEALDLLRRSGWTQFRANRDGKNCASNALCLVWDGQVLTNLDRAADFDALTETAMEQFPERHGLCANGSIVNWNDHPATTFPDIELVYIKAATKRDEVLA